MADNIDDASGEDALRERIRSAVADTPERELVDVDFSGPQVTVIVEEYSGEGEDRTLVERSLYSVHEEPDMDLNNESKSPFEGDHLEWSYLGPVERTDEGWEQVEE